MSENKEKFDIFWNFIIKKERKCDSGC